MKSWKPNVITKDRGIDYWGLRMLSFLRKLDNGLLGLKTVVFFKNIYNNLHDVSRRSWQALHQLKIEIWTT